MKFILASFALIMSVSAGAADYKPGIYKIDPAHSRADFVVKHLVVSEVTGRFNDISGTIVMDEKFSKSSVSASIETKSIDTAVKQRDEHLRSPDFFDVAKYPLMTFKSKSILGTQKMFRVTGDLTIKGVTKEVSFISKYTGFVKDAQGKERVALQGSVKINRQDFGIKYNEMIELGSAVGNEVEITLRLEGIKQ